MRKPVTLDVDIMPSGQLVSRDDDYPVMCHAFAKDSLHALGLIRPAEYQYFVQVGPEDECVVGWVGVPLWELCSPTGDFHVRGFSIDYSWWDGEKLWDCEEDDEPQVAQLLYPCLAALIEEYLDGLEPVDRYRAMTISIGRRPK